MEIMKQNNVMKKPLVSTKNSKRTSYIKPPLPPKPKILPKPTNILPKSLKLNTNNNIRDNSIKILNVNSEVCNSVITITGSSSSCVKISGRNYDEPNIVERHEKICTFSNSINSFNSIIPIESYNNSTLKESNKEFICKTNLDFQDDSLEVDLNSSNDSSICTELNSSNDSSLKLSDHKDDKDSVDDVSSCIMEKTLENCTGLSSKSSSNSSISYGDSDSDEFVSAVKIDQDPCSDGTPSIIITKAYETSSSDSSIANSVNNVIEKDGNCRTKKAYLVAKEIKTSEESFIANLKLLNVDFKNYLITKGCLNVGEKNDRSDILTEKHFEEIFKYLPNLQTLNEEILADFELRIQNWEGHPKIADVIVRKGPFLKIYANYIKELEIHTRLLQKYSTQYSYFGECLKDFENSDLGRYIPISKHMLTPMQRITKYKELMRQYLKYLNEDHVDYTDALQALDIVKGVADHANEAIRELENSARLLCLQERINGISIADGTSMGGSSGSLQHLLVEPGKRLLKEGQLMKLCRRGIRIVYLILLSDSLLYTTEELHGGKNCPLKLRYKLPLEGMRVDVPVSEDFQNEFTVISTSRSFTVRTNCAKERDSWIACLRDAIESNATRRYSFEKAKTADFEYLALNALGKQAPAWIPDNRVTMCQVCTSEFSLTFRRHHCRACGKVVCRICSTNRAPLEYLDNQTERVCDYCFEELLKALEELGEKEDDVDDEKEKERFRKRLKMIKSRFKKGVRDGRRCRLKKPERLLEVCGGDLASQICGYLRHFNRRTWRQSWFVLKDKVMYEYRAPEDVCALTSLPILGYKVNTEFKSFDIFDGMDPDNAFQLEHINQDPLIFYAESKDLASKWRAVMEKEVVL